MTIASDGGGAAVTHGQPGFVGGYGGNTARAALRVDQVLEPLGHEAGDVEIEGSRAGKDLDVPVQPRRSSRCGQSVGISTKFPFWPHMMLCWSWLRSGSEHSKLPVGVMSEWSTITASVSRGSPDRGSR